MGFLFRGVCVRARVCVGVCVCARVLSFSVVSDFCDPIDCGPPGSLSMGFSRQGYWSAVFSRVPPQGIQSLLQGIFSAQGSNLNLCHLLPGQTDSLPLSHLGSPFFLHAILI